MTNRRAPVRYTCPEIDGAIKTVKDISQEIRGYQYDDDCLVLQDRIENIEHYISDLSDMLESLRRSNSDLRDWGDGLVSELEDLEDRYYKEVERGNEN